MTITYTGKVANARMFAFSRLLFYWKGSIYKLIYKEMLVFCGLYAMFSLMYRFALGAQQKSLFEKIVRHCEAMTNLIPLSFVLGFYVSIVITRWWNQFVNIPWPDRAMMYVSTMVDGIDERSRVIRRTLMRYLSLSSLIVFQATSVVVKRRFPTMEHLLEAGVITVSEIQALEGVNTPHGKWWVPIVWACNLIKQGRNEGRISDDFFMKTLMEEMQTFRGQLGMLYSYDWISVPLVYTQVTTLAVYTFFVGCLLGRQFIEPTSEHPGYEVDLYVPVFTLLQFFFYMGWLKVAEQLINPFGDDDDDYNINWIIDRNLQVSLLVVDDMHGSVPHVEKDMYFDEYPPEYLPYTKSSINSVRTPYMGSTANLSVSDHGMKIVEHMTSIPEHCVLDSNNLLNSYSKAQSTQASQPNSPMLSPSKPRRIQNMLLGIRTPLCASKSSIDGLKAGSNSDAKAPTQFVNLAHSLNGVGLSQKGQYIESWIADSSSTRIDESVSALTSREVVPNGTGCNRISGVPATPQSPGMGRPSFAVSMDGEHHSKVPAVIEVKGQPQLENPDVTRVRHIESGANPRRFIVSEPTEITQAPALDVTLGAHAQSSNDAPWGSAGHLNTNELESHVNNSTAGAQNVAHDIPEIVIDVDHCARTRHVSAASSGHSSSSCGSLPSYEQPESHQSTVNSLTPLLNTSGGSNPNLSV